MFARDYLMRRKEEGAIIYYLEVAHHESLESRRAKYTRRESRFRKAKLENRGTTVLWRRRWEGGPGGGTLAHGCDFGLES